MVTTLDFRTIDAVLEMGGGYVLDFSDRGFADFFREHGVDIDAHKYQSDGTSKAKRLRRFLRVTPPPLSGQVLAAMLEHQQVSSTDALEPQVLARYQAIVTRLGGTPTNAPGGTPTAESAILARVFKPEFFTRLPGDPTLHAALLDRMREAQRCIEHEAWLSAVILCGSVLEGMCLGFGEARPETANRAYASQYNKPPPRLSEWRLAEWIDVLTRVGAFSPNVGRFGHAIRDFRNYVHPREQLANGFSPDAHTARIAFQVVLAAVDDLIRFDGVNGPTMESR